MRGAWHHRKDLQRNPSWHEGGAASVLARRGNRCRARLSKRHPAQISTSYVERSNLTLRMSSKRFSRLSNGFSKKLEPHCAAVSLYVAHYNLCRVHESLKCTPAVALGIADRVWTIGDLLDAAMATQPITPTETPAKRRSRFRVIQGDLFE